MSDSSEELFETPRSPRNILDEDNDDVEKESQSSSNTQSQQDDSNSNDLTNENENYSNDDQDSSENNDDKEGIELNVLAAADPKMKTVQPSKEAIDEDSSQQSSSTIEIDLDSDDEFDDQNENDDNDRKNKNSKSTTNQNQSKNRSNTSLKQRFQKAAKKAAKSNNANEDNNKNNNNNNSDDFKGVVEAAMQAEEKAHRKQKNKIQFWIWLICMSLIVLVMVIVFVVALFQRDHETIPRNTLVDCSVSLNASQILYSPGNQTSIVNPSYTIDEINVADCPALEKETISRGYKVVLALIPLVVVFLGILGFKLSSRYVAPAALFVTILIGTHFFDDSEAYRNLSFPEMFGRICLTIVDRFLWNIFDYASNLFSALLFLEILKRWGVVASIRKEFTQITNDPNLLLTMVLFCFGLLLAVVAPGGSNFLIAGSILIKMGIQRDVSEADGDRIVADYDRRHENCTDDDCSHHTATREDKIQFDTNNSIGAVCLLNNALSSAFNLLGVCIIATAPLVTPLDPINHGSEHAAQSHAEIEIGRTFSMHFFLLATVAPVVMQMLFSSRRWPWQKLADVSSWRVHVVNLSCGFVYALFQYITAAYVGPELPCLTAGFASLITFILLVKGKAIVKREWPNKGVSRRYLLPFILLMSVLLIIRLVPGLEKVLNGERWKDELPDQILSPKFPLNGYSKVDFPWLTAPVVLVTAIACVTPFLVPFKEPEKSMVLSFPSAGTSTETIGYIERLKVLALAVGAFQVGRRPFVRRMKDKTSFFQRYKRVVLDAMGEAAGDTSSIIISITSFAAMAKLMSSFGMSQVLADAIVDGLKDTPAIYALFIPFIGMLGSALTGSTTTSNFLFSSLQVITAKNLNLVRPGHNSVYEIVGAQMLGATSGEIMSPLNATVITLVKGVDANESDLIRSVLSYAFVWLLVTMLLSLLFLVPEPFLD